MRALRKMIAGFIAAVLFCSVFPESAYDSFAAANGNIYYIEPQLGDGAYISDSDMDNLYVKGVLYKNGYFTFSETRTITFTVRFEEGWSYCEEYSSVFDGDSGSLVVSKGSNSVTFKYTASGGKSVKFSTLKNVCINTTAEEMPKLYLDISGSFERVTKENWVDCDVRLELGTKNYSSGNFVGSGQVKGRGNYSWEKEQKPYSINFEKDVSLLDIPATRKYAIVSTVLDASLVRNLVMYSAGQDLKGIDYMVKAEPVEVYLNGQFNGIYTLCERIRISKTKINETEASPDNVNGAYLLEKTVTGKMSSSDIYVEAPFLGHPNSSGQKDIFVFKDPDTADSAMKKKISDIVNNVHNAIMSDSETAYLRYIDLDSWLDFIIMQEVSKNVDGDLKTSSFFLVRSGSDVLEFTSLWDFDIAFGVADWNNDDRGSGVTISGTPFGNTPTKFMTIQPSCPWFEALYEKESFRNALMERYTEYRYTVIENMLAKIDYYAAYMLNSAENNVKYLEPSEIREGVEDLKQWLEKRLEWLDGQWLLDSDEVKPHTVSVAISGKGTVEPSDGSYAVTDGGSIEFIISADEGYRIEKAVFDGRDVTDEISLGIYTTPYISKSCTFTVTFAADSGEPAPADEYFSLFVDGDISNGSISLSADSAVAGTVINVSAAPDDGYRLGRITVDGTALSGNSFVMPAKDVVVSADFVIVVSTEENREVLERAIALATGAQVKSSANLSCQAVKDTYDNTVSHGNMIYGDPDASPEQINAAAMDLLRIYGILCRDNIGTEELKVMAAIGELYTVSQELLNAAAAAEESSGNIKEMWDMIIDAVMKDPTKVLLESLCSFYSDIEESGFTEETYQSFAAAMASAEETLDDAAATQSSIDTATAELAVAGRKLAPAKQSGSGDGLLDAEGRETLYTAVKTGSIVLGFVAVATAAFAAVKVAKRMKKSHRES